MQLEYRLHSNANTGVAVHAPRLDDSSFAGLEIQILDDGGSAFQNLDLRQCTGALVMLEGPAQRAARPAGTRNAMRIISRGRKITIILNDIKFVDAWLDRLLAEAEAEAEAARVYLMRDPQVYEAGEIETMRLRHSNAALQARTLTRTKGFLALQACSGRAEFRNVFIKEY